MPKYPFKSFRLVSRHQLLLLVSARLFQKTRSLRTTDLKIYPFLSYEWFLIILVRWVLQLHNFISEKIQQCEFNGTLSKADGIEKKKMFLFILSYVHCFLHKRTSTCVKNIYVFSKWKFLVLFTFSVSFELDSRWSFYIRTWSSCWYVYHLLFVKQW